MGAVSYITVCYAAALPATPRAQVVEVDGYNFNYPSTLTCNITIKIL